MCRLYCFLLRCVCVGYCVFLFLREFGGVGPFSGASASKALCDKDFLRASSACLYVCMYACVHAHAHASTHHSLHDVRAYMHACIHAYTHSINSRDTRAHSQGAKCPFAVGSGEGAWFGRILQAPPWVCFALTHTHTHTHTHTFKHACTHARARKHTHTHTHTGIRHSSSVGGWRYLGPSIACPRELAPVCVCLCCARACTHSPQWGGYPSPHRSGLVTHSVLVIVMFDTTMATSQVELT